MPVVQEKSSSSVTVSSFVRGLTPLGSLMAYSQQCLEAFRATCNPADDFFELTITLERCASRITAVTGTAGEASTPTDPGTSTTPAP